MSRPPSRKLTSPLAQSSPLARPRARFDETLAQRASEAHAGFPARAGSARLRRARANLARVLWTRGGRRRLPGSAELDLALAALPPQELYWICELSPLAPLYLLPTRRFISALVATLRGLEAQSVLEVAAGDGFLSRWLARAAPDLTVRATDSGAWVEPSARMSRSEQREHIETAVPGLSLGAEVERLEARRAIEKYAPDLVLCSWLPPGNMLDALIRAPVRHVLELGAGSGVTASAYSWRFAHEFVEGPLEQTARCRLDARPKKQLHSRATLYFASQHPEFFEEKVRKGDWLHQFKPRA